jgi:hypothetical protein
MSGHYQSRVFTFISKRTNQLKNTCAQGLRHLKVAVVWSGQILLYPLHLLAQTTKIFHPQLSPPPTQRSLPQPDPDLNIEQALDLVAGVGYPTSQGSGYAIAIAERGTITVADPLSHRQLQQVSSIPEDDGLTIADRQLWNIEDGNTDTEDWELVNNARKSRRLATRKPTIRGLSSVLIDRHLVLVTTENEILDILTIAQQQDLRRRIGIDLAMNWASWHRNKLTPHQSSVAKITGTSQLLINNNSPTQLAIASTIEDTFIDRDRDLGSPLEQLRQGWQNWFQKFTSNNSEPIDEIAPADRFQLSPSSYPFTPQPPQISRVFDLPQLPPIIEDESIPDRDPPIQNPLVKLQPDWLRKWLNYYRDYLYIPSQSDRQIVKQAAEFQLIPLTPFLAEMKIDRRSQQIGIDELLGKQDATIEPKGYINDRAGGKLSKKVFNNIEHQPDWIEAESETIGYNRSPLAKFLAWLDRIFFHIENWLIKIWKAITNNPARN